MLCVTNFVTRGERMLYLESRRTCLCTVPSYWNGRFSRREKLASCCWGNGCVCPQSESTGAEQQESNQSSPRLTSTGVCSDSDSNREGTGTAGITSAGHVTSILDILAVWRKLMKIFRIVWQSAGWVELSWNTELELNMSRSFKGNRSKSQNPPLVKLSRLPLVCIG